MPATCVAWKELSGSNGTFAYFHDVDGGVNVRCTITFGVVYFVSPFGNPAGYGNPLGLKYGWVACSPSSMIPIFMPLPAVAKFGPHSLSAPICCGPAVSRSAW